MDKKYKYIALYIEDEPELIKIVHDLLDRVSIDVLGVENGLNALKILNKKKFDLILLDLKLPLMQGDQVMSILKSRNESTPVIVVSGNITRKRMLKLSKLGVKEFLAKPFIKDSLYDTINKVCPIEY